MSWRSCSPSQALPKLSGPLALAGCTPNLCLSTSAPSPTPSFSPPLLSTPLPPPSCPPLSQDAHSKGCLAAPGACASPERGTPNLHSRDRGASPQHHGSGKGCQTPHPIVPQTVGIGAAGSDVTPAATEPSPPARGESPCSQWEQTRQKQDGPDRFPQTESLNPHGPDPEVRQRASAPT